MDTISIIIITAFITSAITGIVSNFIFLRYQKRVENTFAQQLDEFRSNLQYSNFERQTKFARIHEKRVEALEALGRLFRDFAESIRKDLRKVGSIYLTYDQTGFDFADIDFQASFQT